MNDKELNLLISVSKKNIDMAKGTIEQAEYASVSLGIACIKWVNDTLARYHWALPEEAKWENLRMYHDEINISLYKAGVLIEKANSKLLGIFTGYTFKRIDKISTPACWEMYNNISRLDFSDINTESDVTGPYIEDYINRLNTTMDKMRIDITPDTICDLMIKVANIKGNVSVCDTATGTSTILVKLKEYMPEISVFGQDINEEMVIISKINLLLHGIIDWELEEGDIFGNPRFIDGASLKKFDCILSNLPFIPANWGMEEARQDRYGRFIYGLNPAMSGEWAFVQHNIAALKDNGKAVIVTTKGSLMKEVDQSIRETLVKADIIETVIDLPGRIFENTAIPICILVINKDKPKNRIGKIQFIDATRLYNKDRRIKTLNREQICEIVEAYEQDTDIDAFSKTIDIDEIKRNDYKMNCLLYLAASNIGEKLVNASELKDITKQIFRGVQLGARDLEELQKQTNKGYYLVNTGDIKDGEIIYDQLTEIALKSSRWESLYVLKPGDLLISARGSQIKIAIVPEGKNSLVIAGNLICLRVDQNIIDPYYTKIFLESPVGQTLLESVHTGSVIKVINAKNMESIPVPILPMQIQKSIVAEYKNGQEKYNIKMQEAQKELLECISNVYQSMGLDNDLF